jgi:hypothetical protein
MAATQLQLQANHEASENGKTAAKIILIPLLVVGAVAIAAANSQQPPERVYVCRGWNCP